jgi:transcriptional regulator with XRE-family HTH domain
MPNTPAAEQFGIALRAARRRAGMTQAEVAAKLGHYDQSYIGRLERAEENPTGSAMDICTAAVGGKLRITIE